MTIKDISNGPDWIIWDVFAIFALISVVFLSGHGANFIAGYNTANREEQEKYDSKKLCHVVGGGMSIITALIFIMAVGEILPAYIAYIFSGVIIIDCIVIIVLANTICKK